MGLHGDKGQESGDFPSASLLGRNSHGSVVMTQSPTVRALSSLQGLGVSI